MLSVEFVLYLILLPSVVTTLQLNLYHTDWINSRKVSSDNTLEHNCFRIYDNIFGDSEIIFYCLSELPSKFNIENYDYFSKFTFDQLAIQNITSEQLFLWSASIDLIENYLSYLNQLSTTNNLSLAKQVFYNCTLPRFGPMCQYQLDYYQPDHSSISDIVRSYYHMNQNSQTDLTCYVHLECIQHLYPPCLDWTDICDGKVDCLNGGIDEKHCWELEINECNDNEYRCKNGQCIPYSFFYDAYTPQDCMDASDEQLIFGARDDGICWRKRPSFACDDTKCNNTMHLSSSCIPDRKNLLQQRMFSIKNDPTLKQCWSVLKCLFNIQDTEYPFCNILCANDGCKDSISKACPDMLYFPNVPVFFDDIYLAFKKNDSNETTMENIGLLYICYNNSRYDTLFNMTSKILFNNTACFLHEKISYPSRWFSLWNTALDKSLRELNDDLKKFRLLFHYTFTMCNRSNMYQCMNSSKCISVHRLMDNFNDCPYMDDEMMFAMNSTNVIAQLKQTHYKCQFVDKYIHKLMIRNQYCDCPHPKYPWCEDEDQSTLAVRTDISFQTTCDGFVELFPMFINSRNETDETECEQWECDNIYTHCDGIWNCPNGADEIGCNSLISFKCSPNNHVCVSPSTNELMCLSIDRANDGKVDCVGGTDEPSVCRINKIFGETWDSFHCINQVHGSCISSTELCDGNDNCEQKDDEQFCKSNITTSFLYRFCTGALQIGSDVEKFLCDRTKYRLKKEVKYFSLEKPNIKFTYTLNNVENILTPSSSLIQISDQFHSRCHHGLPLTVWLNIKTNSTINTCLCPSSFYGDRCQYQNQRISLILQFRALSDSRNTPFAIVISLIDNSDQRIIHSYHQVFYLSKQYCKTKFYVYLLYSTRPKDPMKNYSIHIDIYEKQTDSLLYRGSVLYAIPFQFLPVHRLAFIVNIPRSNDETLSCSDKKCHHGKCMKYTNNPQTRTFCQCDEGWSGKYCTIRHICTCANGSLCIGVAANNQSICVCPLNRFGPRCLLMDTTCQNDNNSICENGGRCVFNANYRTPTEKYYCICLDGFSGPQCEYIDYQLAISFNDDISLSQSILIHFIKILPVQPTRRWSTFQTIRFQQNSVIIYSLEPFQVAFIELSDQTFYLALVRPFEGLPPLTANSTVTSSDRCPNITELFNQTFLRWPLIRRIKYYHLPCRNPSLNLSCFHDEAHFCLCQTFQQKRVANCVKFDHHMKFDCFGQNECENDAQCFQDHQDCPQKSLCKCLPCYYGRRCQFSTSGFGLSLDAIIGYHIISNVTIPNQPPIVKFAFAFTIVFMLTGLVDGILCIITFKNKSIRGVGCGLYLLASSIATVCIMIMFTLKFLILLLGQMEKISNRSFLHFQCMSFDFILRVCLSMDEWLSACVATERAITTIKAARFDKKKSKRMAKYVIVILLIIIIGSSIHDPIYRRLIDEVDDTQEKRTWCVVKYSSGLQIFNSVIHSIHFFGPFILNLVSSIMLIKKKSHQELSIHKDLSYKEIQRRQLFQHKNLLVGPVVLVILGLPRLIITYVSKCMKHPSDAWLFLIGYLISFIPCMLTFIIFVLPSEFYKKEFIKTVVQYRNNIRRRLRLRSLNDF